MAKDDSGAAGPLLQGQFHRGDLLGVRSSVLEARDGAEALTWYSIMLAVDGSELAVGSASEKGVRAALSGYVVGESVELPTYSKITSGGKVSVRLAGAGSADGGRGEYMPEWAGPQS